MKITLQELSVCLRDTLGCVPVLRAEGTVPVPVPIPETVVPVDIWDRG